MTSRKTWFLLVDRTPKDGRWNMAVDEFLFRQVQQAPLTFLRFYAWDKPTVSLGFYQKTDQVLDLEVCRRQGVDVVRRMTGGKLVLHHEEVTYTVASSEADIFSTSLKESYRLVSEALILGLKRLGLEAKVDVIIGTTSSGVALAQAPVADEIKTIYIIPHAASYKVVMEPHKYVFRTNGHTGAVPIAMALYVLKKMPDVKRVAHIDMDYAWGRDNWNVFIATLKKYKPDVEVVAEVWEKVGEVDHSTAITKVLAAKPDIVFNSHWGGQLVSLVRQAIEYKFFEYTTFVCTVIEEAFPEIGPDFPEGCLLYTSPSPRD